MMYNSEITTDISILTKPCEEFDFNNPPFDPNEFSAHLVRVMNLSGGAGLSAIQLGYHYRIFAMVGEPEIICFNPIILEHTKDIEDKKEGCLSFPGLKVKTKRYMNIIVQFQSALGKRFERSFVGIQARCYQHELDHCNGKLFFENCSRLRIEKAVKDTPYESMGLLKYAKD